MSHVEPSHRLTVTEREEFIRAAQLLEFKLREQQRVQGHHGGGYLMKLMKEKRVYRRWIS